MSEKAAHDVLMNFISCKCQKGYTRSCACRQVGLECSDISEFCSGHSCGNAASVRIEIVDDGEESKSETQELVDVEELNA